MQFAVKASRSSDLERKNKRAVRQMFKLFWKDTESHNRSVLDSENSA